MSDASSEPEALKPTEEMPRRPANDIIQVVLLSFVAFVVPQVFVGMISPLLYKLMPAVSENLIIFGAYLLVELVTIGLILWLVKTYTALRRVDLGLTKFKGEYIGRAVAGYIAYFGLSILLITLAMVIFNIKLDDQQELGFEDPTNLELVLIGMALMVAVPIAEELLFRGLLFGGLRRHLSFKWTAIIVSLLFGLVHIDFSNMTLVALGVDVFALSLVLCYMRENTGSLWASILIHGLKNGVAFYIGFIYNGG